MIQPVQDSLPKGVNEVYVPCSTQSHFFLFMLLLTLIYIPENTGHLSESCGEDFGSLESDAMLPAQTMLSHRQFVCLLLFFCSDLNRPASLHSVHLTVLA